MISRAPGIEDIFPDRIDPWNHIVGTARKVMGIYNYREIIIPVMEFTEVFVRGLGTDTDIVSKEMFTFEDRGGRSLTLRPEGTASVVRAYVENGHYNRLSSCKLFYVGPMFRAERPQRGRLRQFNQFGAEFFGSSDPYYDYEAIDMMNEIALQTGIRDYELLINSIGCPGCRDGYIAALKDYFKGEKESLCQDCLRRLDTNPLRILDCKKEPCAALKKEAPVITEHLCSGCVGHQAALKGHLSNRGISFTEDPHLVRGIDYYTRTTFEFVSSQLGGQNAFAAGGRYDNLVEDFGGKPTPAVGFAAGIERIMLLLEDREITPRSLDVFLVHSGEMALAEAIRLCDSIRKAGLSADLDPESKGFKAQFKKADRDGAAMAVVIGEEEMAGGFFTVKDLRSGEQQKISKGEILNHIGSIRRKRA